MTTKETIECDEGYRYLKVGEVVVRGDQWYNSKGQWEPMQGFVGDTIKESECSYVASPSRSRRAIVTEVTPATILFNTEESGLLIDLIDRAIGKGMDNVIEAGHLCNAFTKLRDTQ